MKTNADIIKEILEEADCLDEFILERRKARHKNNTTIDVFDFYVKNEVSPYNFCRNFILSEYSFSWSLTRRGYAYWEGRYRVIRKIGEERFFKTAFKRTMLMLKKCHEWRHFIHCLNIPTLSLYRNNTMLVSEACPVDTLYEIITSCHSPHAATMYLSQVIDFVMYVIRPGWVHDKIKENMMNIIKNNDNLI